MRKLILVLAALVVSNLSAQNQGGLTIIVKGLRNNKGQVGIRLFDQPKGFPSKKNRAIQQYFVKPVNNQAKFTISNLSFKNYAVGSIHDENSNKELDKNFFGVPKEGFGTSNNPKVFMGAPSYEKAKFTLSKKEQTIVITMKYF